MPESAIRGRNTLDVRTYRAWACVAFVCTAQTGAAFTCVPYRARNKRQSRDLHNATRRVETIDGPREEEGAPRRGPKRSFKKTNVIKINARWYSRRITLHLPNSSDNATTTKKEKTDDVKKKVWLGIFAGTYPRIVRRLVMYHVSLPNVESNFCGVRELKLLSVNFFYRNRANRQFFSDRHLNTRKREKTKERERDISRTLSERTRDGESHARFSCVNGTRAPR